MTVTFNNVADYAHCLFVLIGITDDGKTDAICFSVDKDIVLHGVCLLGREISSHFVQLDVIEVFSESSVTSKAGQFSSELMKRNTDYSYHGYRVSFDKHNVPHKS